MKPGIQPCTFCTFASFVETEELKQISATGMLQLVWMQICISPAPAFTTGTTTGSRVRFPYVVL